MFLCTEFSKFYVTAFVRIFFLFETLQVQHENNFEITGTTSTTMVVIGNVWYPVMWNSFWCLSHFQLLLISEVNKLDIFKQDWLADEVNEMKVTLENITVARDWLLGMGYGAMMNNITIQYCQPMPRQLLQSVEIPQLTQVTDFITNNQWYCCSVEDTPSIYLELF